MPRKKADKAKVTFSGYQSPHYTIVPDELFDEQMVDLSGSELKVLLYIIRHTFGFKKDDDNISISQMLFGITRRDGTIQDRGCGLSKPALLQALRDLQERNLIIAERRISREKGNEPTNYRLNVLADPRYQVQTPPLVKKVDQGVGKKTLPSPWSKKLTTQETIEQETTLQETNISNSFELLTQKSKNRSTFGNSKKRDKIDQTVSQQIAEPQQPRRTSGGMKGIGELLEHHSPSDTAANGTQKPVQARKRGRPPKAPEQIAWLMGDISREFHDAEKLLAPVQSHVARHYRESGLSESDFVSVMYEARSRTKGAGDVEKRAAGEAGQWGVRNKVPYWFSCLHQLLGIEDCLAEKNTVKRKSSSTKSERTPERVMGNL